MLVPFLIIASAISGPIQSHPAPERIQNPGLADNLAKMVALDQEARMEMIELMKGGKPVSQELASKLAAIDSENTGKLRQIIRTYGWPTFDMVGKRGSGNAWLLVQHADHSPKFQRECLDLMEPLVRKGQVSKQNFAYLTDRVRLAEGKKQLYATQFIQNRDGSWSPKPIEDPDNVEKRRAEMELGTLAEYKKKLEEMYGTKPPAS